MTMATTPSYGADQHGLICGYRFAPAGNGQPLDLAQAAEWLRTRADGSQEFLWLHFNLTAAAAQAWMQDHLSAAPQFFAALRQDSRSTRIEDADDNLIAVVNDVAYEFAFDTSHIATLWLNVSERVVVSARVHPARSIDQLRQAVKEGARFASSVALLNHLMS